MNSPSPSGFKFPAKIRIKVVLPKNICMIKILNYLARFDYLPVPFSPSKTMISDSVNDPSSTLKSKVPKFFFIAG